MRRKERRGLQSWILYLMVLLSAILTAAVFLFLILYILIKGVPHLSPSLFELDYNSENVSLMPAFLNTMMIAAVSLAIAVPVGIGAAIYLAEYAKRGNRLVSVIGAATETLAGIPSIVYGLFGMLFFVKAMHMGLSVLAGAFTLSIMILPLIMRTTEEALKSVPDTYREGSYGLGAGHVRTIFRILLPSAMPGILAGVILAVGRIVGETAALMYTAGTVADIAEGLKGSGRTLAYHMYYLSGEGLHIDQAYATAVTLLVIVMAMNWISGRIAKKLVGR